jgi:hypothetical protein
MIYGYQLNHVSQKLLHRKRERMKSNYTLAGFETLNSIVDNFVKNTKERYTDNFTREDISRFFTDTTHGFLHSFGQNFTGKKSYKNYVKSEVEIFNKCRRSKLFEGSEFVADSGGFQASIGKLKKNETQNLVKLYDEFLTDQHYCIDKAFVLDLAPGPGCDLFNNFKDVYDVNLQTYSMAANLPDDARKKMIYIQHFRTPKLYEIFDRLLKENNFFEKFDHFATGGIVASKASDSAIPCIIYVIPLTIILNEAVKHKRKKVNFHILGGAGFREVLYYEMIQRHVYEIHGIELTISYDSSGMFKALMVGRVLPVFHEKTLYKLDIRTNNLDMRFKGSILNEEIFFMQLNEMAEKHNFKPLNMTKIYNPDDNTFYEDVKVYVMFYMLEFYSKLQTYMREFADENYPLYKSGNYEELNRRICHVTKNLNDGKTTAKQHAKMCSLIPSLSMLTNLDEDYCKYIVDKSLSSDEFTDLMHKPSMLSF